MKKKLLKNQIVEGAVSRMVKKINKNNKSYYQCVDCKLIYDDINWANKCEDWCKKYKSCNLEITKHAIK